MRNAFYLLPLLLLLGCGAKDPEASAQTAASSRTTMETRPLAPVDRSTMHRFHLVMDYARRARLHERQLGEIMQAVGLRFSGAPYEVGLLDRPTHETLVVNLSGFDCVLFVETALALGRGIAEEDYSYATFTHHLRSQRYRDGRMQGYCSRLHYFSEWIADNEARGAVHNITRDLGGIRLEKQLRFMSEHRSSYPRLVASDSLFAGIEAMETRLKNFALYYIPQDRIRTIYNRLRAGDIIAIATSVKGLDVSHTGLVYDAGEGKKGLLHASTSGGVKVSPDLQAYIENNKIQIGIVVARPVTSR